jgi:phosphopantetheine--protein transferase-like protein
MVHPFIAGIGLDLVDIADFALTLNRAGDEYLDRVFTEQERTYCGAQAHPVQSYAARFAAKEAAMKALGIAGIDGLERTDIEVTVTSSGMPELTLHGVAAANAKKLGIRHLAVSLTHSLGMAGAVVVAELVHSLPRTGQLHGGERSSFNVARLLVFEGPDGTGKSTLSARVLERLRQQGVAAVLLAFPGREPGTLGAHVHDVHHNPGQFHITQMSEASKQLLHVAAHIDTIEFRIRPLLAAGTTVILDRYWWSTFVYGVTSGIDQDLLWNMIDIERRVWDTIIPQHLFLITRSAPLRPEPLDVWAKWDDAYHNLAEAEKEQHRVSIIENDGTIEEAVERIVACL